MTAAPRPPAPTPRLRGDEGVSLPLIGVMIVVLLAFTGFAVDVGQVYGQRRQAQSAADTAALAAADDLLLPGGSRELGAAWSKALSYESIGGSRGTPTEWNAQFATCVDPAAHPIPGLVSTSLTASQTGGEAWPADPTAPADPARSCISYTRNGQRVRVRIPPRTLVTVFAGLVGHERFTTTAAAEAQVGFVYPGGVLPYGIPAISIANTTLCLGTQSALPDYLDSCEGNQQGNFGALDPSFFGNLQLGTSTFCSDTSSGGNNSQNRIAMATSVGIDHPIDVVPASAADPDLPTSDLGQVRNDRTICTSARPFPPPFLAMPNEMPTETGLSAVRSGVRWGLYQGVSAGFGLAAQPGRLTRSSDRVTVHQRWPALDDQPLWQYLTPGLTAGGPGPNQVPQACVRDFEPSTWSRSRMVQCLDQWIAGGYTTILFGADTDGDDTNGIYDIMRNPRFGFVPLLWTNFGSGSSDDVQIRDFRAVFIQTLFWGCDSNRCQRAFDPGEDMIDEDGNVQNTPIPEHGPDSGELDAVTALAIRMPMLPVEARQVSPAGANELGVSLVR